MIKLSNPKDISNFRRRIKIALVVAFGNKCQICGNSFPNSIYEFHHLVPKEKKFSAGSDGITHSKKDFAEEMKKCIMVCANCHRLIEHEGLDIEGIYCVFDEELYYKTLEDLTRRIKKEKPRKEKAKSKIPPREILKEQIRHIPFVQIGKIYDVTDNAIRKWCKKYNLPNKSTEIKNISEEDWLKI